MVVKASADRDKAAKVAKVAPDRADVKTHADLVLADVKTHADLVLADVKTHADLVLADVKTHADPARAIGINLVLNAVMPKAY